MAAIFVYLWRHGNYALPRERLLIARDFRFVIFFGGMFGQEINFLNIPIQL